MSKKQIAGSWEMEFSGLENSNAPKHYNSMEVNKFMPCYVSDHFNSLCVPAVISQSHIIQSEDWRKNCERESDSHFTDI